KQPAKAGLPARPLDIVAPPMQVSATTQPCASSGADTVAVGVFEEHEPAERAPEELRELVLSGEARRSFKALALAHSQGRRWLAVGLGPRDQFTAERARVAAAVVRERARELSTRALCWEAPADVGADVVGALVEGTLLADYRFDRHKSAPAEEEGGEPRPRHLEKLIVSSPADLAASTADSAL